MEKQLGPAGKLAKYFIRSKLTVIIVALSLFCGCLAILLLPREEEPQIVVPMVDIMVQYPGASPQEVEARVTTPMEKLLWGLDGVEYVYSTIQTGENLTIVRFKVGEDAEKSLVNVYNKLMSNYDQIPNGVSEPLVRLKSIDDVPILAVTFSSADRQYTGYELRRIAAAVAEELKKDERVSNVDIIGGSKRQIKITLDPVRLAAYKITAGQIASVLAAANAMSQPEEYSQQNKVYILQSGSFLKNAREIENLVVGTADNKVIYLREVAAVEDGAAEAKDYTFIGFGPAGMTPGIDGEKVRDAVTVTVAKKKGMNASDVAQTALQTIDKLHTGIIPQAVAATVTRNYGETAKDKSNELLEHMLIATVSVVVLIAVFLGRKAAAVVSLAVPVTLALTLFISYFLGYTLNRVTLFALIFSIGILVDDAIVVVENIHRHFIRRGGADEEAAVQAVDEVGNPTILATFTVVAALLPMAFVSGLMGPYMRPIPVGASAAMLFSLFIAFVVSPWLSYKLLASKQQTGKSQQLPVSRIRQLYEKVLRSFLYHQKKRHLAFGLTLAVLAATLLIIPLKAVMVKMLPFDNKSELQLVVDMPKGTTLEQTAQVVRQLGDYLGSVPEVRDYECYIGNAGPYNFNGLVRHYYLRHGSNVADIQVNFNDRAQRTLQSHELARRLRPELQAIGQPYQANIKLAEIPPGPPVLSTLVAEIYGTDDKQRQENAQQVKELFSQTEGVVDVDWYVDAEQPRVLWNIDRVKAAINGVQTTDIVQLQQMASSGYSPGLVHFAEEKEPVEMMLRMKYEDRNDLLRLGQLSLLSREKQLIPLSAFVQVQQKNADQTIYHKNMQKVTYVVGDVAGSIESPVYAILAMKDKLNQALPGMEQYFSRMPAGPEIADRYSLKWDGEWQITYEVFRDMGLAFAVVLFLIYVLVVAWYKSFATPLAIMAPIPLTLIGILPGHWLFHAFFTATSMIGFIALAGIVVRNSILLIDFVELELVGSERSLEEALIEAGSVRLRPIVLTAAAVLVGSVVMLFDPIFQGLAISMIFGAVIATGLTLLLVPLLYYEIFRQK